MAFLRVDSNVPSVLAEVARLNERLNVSLTAANRRIALKLGGDAKRIMQEGIYNVPIPLTARAERTLGPNAAVREKTTKGKHGRWSRTGNLKRRETAIPNGATGVTLRNEANYSEYRHELGKPGRRRAGVQSEKSPTQPCHWQEQAVEQNDGWIRQQYERALSEALERTVSL